MAPTAERELSDVKIGALPWPQYTPWPALRQAGIDADRLGYDDLWTWDHLYPIVGDSRGPMFEGYLTLASWAENTERVRMGLMVGANPYPQPGAGGQDGHPAGPHDRRAGDLRPRRGVEQRGGRRLRDRVRRLARGAAALARGGGGHRPRHAPRGGAQRVEVLRGRPRHEPAAAGPGTSAVAHRRGRGTQDAADRGAVRRRLQSRRRNRAGDAQGAGAARPLRRGRAGPWRRSSAPPGMGMHRHPRHPRGGPGATHETGRAERWRARNGRTN